MPPISDLPPPPPVGATVHVYRGLMDRASTWRIRIDIPTNWAVLTSGTAASFTLSEPEHSHIVLLLVMVFTLSFMLIEARRYRYYDLWAGWLRLLEADYYADIMADNQVSLGQTWQDLVVRDMTFPHFKTTLLQSVGRRLRDNYLAIYLFLILAWLLKLSIHPRVDLPPISADTWVDHAAVGALSGTSVTAAVLLFYIGLLLLTLLTPRLDDPAIEVMARTRLLQKLASPAQQPVSRRWHPDTNRGYRSSWDDTRD
jgi:uncharacterized membrane protein